MVLTDTFNKNEDQRCGRYCHARDIAEKYRWRAGPRMNGIYIYGYFWYIQIFWCAGLGRSCPVLNLPFLLI